MASDLEKLQGTWHVTSLEADGEHMPASAFDGALIVVEKDHFTSLGMGLTYEGTFVIGRSGRPKTLDMEFTAGHAAGVRHPGIYKLTGDKWTLCLNTRGNERPERFATRPDSGLVLESLERGPGRKSARGKTRAQSKTSASREATPVAATPPGEVTPLEGEWVMTSAVFNGTPMSDSMVEWTRREMRGNSTTVFAGPQVLIKATFTIDDSTMPHTIDYMNMVGANRGKAQAGIFELKGDDLRLCMAATGNARPDDFTSKSKDGRTFTTWRRKKN